MVKRILTVLCVFTLLGSGAFAAVVTVSGGTGLQAGIDLANPGDTVEVTDSLTYAEDIFINKDNLTLVCTAVNPATIEAQNAALRGDLGTLIGDLGRTDTEDDLGLYIEADGVTVDNFNIVNLTGTANPQNLNRACAVNIHGSNNTVQNCNIVGPDNSNNDCAVQIGWGDISTANLAGSSIGSGRLCDGNTLSNCHFAGRQGVHLHDVAYQDLTATNRQATTNGIIADCTFECIRRAFEPRGDSGYNINRCTWIHPAATTTDSAIKSFGGSITYNECVVLSPGHRLSFQPAPGNGAEWPTTVFNNCVICAGQPGDNVVLMDEGNYIFNRCIVSASSGAPATNFFNNGLLHLRYSAIDGTWGAGNNAPLGTSGSIDVDHCDLMVDGGPSGNFSYGLFVDDISSFFNGIPPIPTYVSVTNTIGLGNQGIVAAAGEVVGLLYGAGFIPLAQPNAASTMTVENNAFTDLFDPVAPILGSQGRIQVDFTSNWTDTSSPPLNPGQNLIDENPLYVGNVLSCGENYANSFIYLNEEMNAYAGDGGPIGSQGGPPIPTASVEDWKLYN